MTQAHSTSAVCQQWYIQFTYHFSGAAE